MKKKKEKKKKKKEEEEEQSTKKKQKKVELKEIKLRPVTEVHDYTFKIKNAQKFLAKGDKVKFTIRFKGRELQHSSLGNELMDKIKQDMQEIGRVELQPKLFTKHLEVCFLYLAGILGRYFLCLDVANVGPPALHALSSLLFLELQRCQRQVTNSKIST